MYRLPDWGLAGRHSHGIGLGSRLAGLAGNGAGRMLCRLGCRQDFVRPVFLSGEEDRYGSRRGERSARLFARET